MTPSDALKTATLNAATLLRIEDELGIIKEGYYADIVAVKKDPIKDINDFFLLSFFLVFFIAL